jgi:IK cytokine
MLHGPEVDQALDAKQLYEQSKYLGGDVQHTHLVKGLDFALLKKVRTDLAKQQHQQPTTTDMDIDHDEQEEKVTAVAEEEEEEEEEEDLDDALERFERGEKLVDDTTTTNVQEEKPKYRTLIAKNIYDLIMNDAPTKVEQFEPGRMAYVFELADEVGHYSDAFAIPTAVIRSKTDMNSRQQSSWTEEADLVVDKIAQVIRRGGGGSNQGGKAVAVKKQGTILTSEPVAMVDDGFMGDIFADVGRDYQLDESETTADATMEEDNKTKSNYFQGLVQEEEEDVDMLDKNEEVNALLSQVQQQKQPEEQDPSTSSSNNTNKRRRYNEMVDADAADIDMFGLSSSALPTSFEEHTTAYQSDDEEDDNTTLQMVDQGTNRNKKAQKTRWDFDTEDEWQNYKDTIEIQPKSAYQFGVKLGDGRKRNRERKPASDKQRLDRDYQQVKNIMSKKYGKSLDQ